MKPSHIAALVLFTIGLTVAIVGGIVGCAAERMELSYESVSQHIMSTRLLCAGAFLTGLAGLILNLSSSGSHDQP